MYSLKISDKLENILRKLYKKDKQRYDIIMQKIDEIIDSDPNHYKNLRYDLKAFKRVHIDAHFVLIFRVDEENKIVEFFDLNHHDKIYY